MPLNSKPNLKNEYIYPSLLDKCLHDTINIQYFILYIFIFFFPQFAYIHVIFWKNNLGM